MRTTVLAAVMALALAAPARAATEKMAVLVLATAESQGELADNVTEMVIGFLAKQRQGTEIAGKEEFRGRLGVAGDRQAQVCLDDISCLTRAAVSLGVRRIVSGNVGSRGKQYLFNLALNNVESGKVEGRVFRLVDGGLDDLISAVREASEELFRPRVEPGRIQIRSDPAGARVSIDHAYLGVTPLMSGTLLPGRHKVRVEAEGRFPWLSEVEILPGQDLGITLGPANLPARRRWPATVAYGTAGLAGLSLATGGFLGVLSQLNPGGATRSDVMKDLRQKDQLATGANAAFITGGALALISIVHFIVYRDDIFDRGE